MEYSFELLTNFMTPEMLSLRSYLSEERWKQIEMEANKQTETAKKEWRAVEQSAVDAAEAYLKTLSRNVSSLSEHSKPDAVIKAIALLGAATGHPLSEKVANRSILENWEAFQGDFRKVWKERGKSFADNLLPWKLGSCLFWTYGASQWPLAYWTDNAVVSFFEVSRELCGIDGEGVTLDTWRRYRRSAKLKRPRWLYVRDCVPVRGADGSVIGLEMSYRRTASDKNMLKHCALEQEGSR